MKVDDLKKFEKKIEEQFISGKIKGPIHLSGGNEKELIEIFKQIHEDDWVFSTYRNHFHALLHGVPEEELMKEVLAGRNMNFSSAKRKFFTSAIVGGNLSIATGVAFAMKKMRKHNHVWCFIGDMAASTGAFHEAYSYSARNNLPITFIIEDNEMSANSPTDVCWGRNPGHIELKRYKYMRTYPHAGASKWVNF